MYSGIETQRFISNIKGYTVLILLFGFSQTIAVAGELTGNLGLAARYYPQEASFVNQEDEDSSLTLQAEFRHKWDNNFNVFTFVPFYRIDQHDEERTHGDIRQLDFLKYVGSWEYQVGISKVFWGVAESAHLVDIVNQTDGVESLDGEEKLGQPLLRASYIHDDGALSFLVLPYFRERTFVGERGRLRPGFPVDPDGVGYESSAEENHVDYAMRVQHIFGAVDVGISYFDGTSRTPYYVPDFSAAVLRQYYPLIKQAGLDLQYTGDNWLWKLEVINRDSVRENFTAEVGGFEYTIPGFAGTRAELGLLAEYHYDSRGDVIDAPFQNDLFLGARIVLSDMDAECLIGGFVDLDNETKSFTLEYTSRLSEKFQLNIEAQAFANVDEQDPFYDLKNDGFIEAEIKYFF